MVRTLIGEKVLNTFPIIRLFNFRYLMFLTHFQDFYKYYRMDYDNPTFSFIDYMVVSPYILLCCYLYYRVVRIIANIEYSLAIGSFTLYSGPHFKTYSFAKKSII